MKFLSSDVVEIKERNPFKLIEKVGRTCYKSSSDMTEETAKKFYSRMVNSHHYAMVEHATFCFSFSRESSYHVFKELYGKYLYFTEDNSRFLMSGNLRALNETFDIEILEALRGIDPLLKYAENSSMRGVLNDFLTPVDFYTLPNITENEFMNHAYYTMHFICDRGVSHEIVRHRPSSFAQESTRYCNYGKDKFGNEISVIYPADYFDWDLQSQAVFRDTCESCEKGYMFLLKSGRTPQEARGILPTQLKTEVIMTTNAKEWEHFIDLRYKGVTGPAHPDMVVVAKKVNDLYMTEKNSILQ